VGSSMMITWGTDERRAISTICCSAMVSLIDGRVHADVVVMKLSRAWCARARRLGNDSASKALRLFTQQDGFLALRWGARLSS